MTTFGVVLKKNAGLYTTGTWAMMNKTAQIFRGAYPNLLVRRVGPMELAFHIACEREYIEAERAAERRACEV